MEDMEEVDTQVSVPLSRACQKVLEDASAEMGRAVEATANHFEEEVSALADRFNNAMELSCSEAARLSKQNLGDLVLRLHNTRQQIEEHLFSDIL